MVRFTNLLKAFGMSMLFTMGACSSQKITMKALVLSTAQTESEAITLNLNSYGIPYDFIEFSSSSQLKGNLTLYNENNEPKYNLVVVNGGYLSFESGDTWVSALNAEQWAYLNEYEARNGVRRVVISEDISYNPEIELSDPNNWGESKDKQDLIVETSSEIKNLFNEARMKITAPLDVNGIFHNRVKIVNTNTTTPFLYYSDNGSKGPVAATLTKYEDGREKMSFYFGFGSWSQSSIMLGHLWLTWGTRSLFNGFRRVYFTPHIDDVFLDTELVDVKHNEVYTESSEVFRTKKEDYQKIAQFQKDVLKIMPEGSFYRVELAFNGNGLLLKVDYDTAVEVDGERYVDLEFVKEPGTGEYRWPKSNYQFSEKQLANFKKDDLYQYFANNEEAQKEFFWSSHTFSHENLDNASRSDVDNEIRLNIEVAEMLGLLDKDYWSGGSIITPQISGLHNKDALEIFKKYGIFSATGDLSRPAICNVANPYLPYYTTMESSNLEGFPVVPRTPTETYYFCSTREENTWMYNQIYNNYFGRDSTWDEIAEREAKRTLLLMTKLRHEAHQFHQANLRYYKKEGNYGESLLEDWTRSVVNLYTKYVDWPLISVKMDDQAQHFIDRAKLEACGHKTELTVEDNKITGITVSASKGDCTVPITVPSGVNKSSLPSDARLEQIGKDPLTVWIPLKKGESKSFELDPPLAWTMNDSPIIVDPVTTAVVDPTTTVVVEPTTVVTVEPVSSVVTIPTSVVVDPTTTVVVDPTTTATETTVVIEPVSSVVTIPTTVVVDPTATTTVDETTVVIEPVSSVVTIPTSVVVDPTATTTVDETSVVVIEPVSSVVTIPTSVVVDPTATTTVDETSVVVIEPVSSVVTIPTSVVVDPTTTVEEVDPTTTADETSVVVIEPVSSVVTIPTSVVVDPTTTVEEVDPTTTADESSVVVIEPVSSVVTIPTTVVVDPTTTVEEVDPTSVDTESVEYTTEYSTIVITNTITIDDPTSTVVIEPTETIDTITLDDPTSTIVIEPTVIEETCRGAYERCGGKGYDGSECCVDGYYCKVLNEWYSQCVPGKKADDEKKTPDDVRDTNTTTTKKHKKTTTTTTTKKHKKTTTTTTTKKHKKTTTTTTTKKHKKTTTTTTKKHKKTTTTTTKKNKKTTTTTKKSKTTSTSKKCKNQAWDKCGGKGFNGSTCCPSGYTCQFYSEWYSQCIPK